MSNGTVAVRLWERFVGKDRTREETERFQADIVGDGFDHHAVAETASEALFLAAQRWRFHDEATDITPIKFDEIRARIAAGETRTDWARVNALTDEDIEAAMRDDPDWKDHIDEDWSDAELVVQSDDPQHVPTEVGAWDGDISDWEIDHSTGRPILTYKKCSVIEAEDAEFVLRAIRDALSTAAPVTVKGVDSQVLVAARDEGPFTGSPEWLWRSHETGVVGFGRWSKAAGQAPYIRADLVLSAFSPVPMMKPTPQCCMCGKKGLSTAEGDGGGECELTDGRWTCSQECWGRAVDPQPVAWRYKAIYANGNPVPGWQFSETPSLLGLYEPLFAYPPDIAAENARLREALAPFAAEADEHDGASAIFSAEVPIAWLRLARSAHKGGAA